MLELIPSVLRCQDERGACARLRAHYTLMLYERLQQCLLRAAHAGNGAARGVATAIDTLDDTGVWHVLAAPRCVHALYFEPAPARVVEQLAAWLMGDDPAPDERWLEFLPTGLVVELRGPHVALGQPGRVPAAVLGEAEARVVVPRLVEAMRGIERAAPAAADVVTSFLRVVALSARERGGFAPLSSARYIGLVLLQNPHHADVTEPVLADTLLGEAVHALLHGVELRRPLVPRPDRAAASRVWSPWTDAALALDDFLRACVVAFARWSFWRRAERTGALPAATCAAMADRARHGFEAMDLRAVLAPHLDALDPGMVDLVVALQAEALGQGLA